MDEVKSRTFHVYDRRKEHVQDKRIHFAGLSYSELKQRIREEFQISNEEEFVVDDTSKDTLRSLPDLSGLKNNATLVVQNEEGEAYSTPVKQNINVQPHYSTILKSGRYDYCVSEGRDPFPYALAELIDNSLSATASNTGPRKIEVRLYLDGSLSKNWMVCVLDNGIGMTAKELGDWAVLRKSKFDATREYNRAAMDSPHKPRFLNSDISFFGVGGKQACFYIGESVTVFTKAAGSPNVCEVTMSKDRFEEREKSGKQVYDEELTHRQPGDDSFLPSSSNPLMRSLIQEESGKESFTHVVITETRKERRRSFRNVMRQVEQLCMELANIYHYYIHGETGIRPDSNGSTPNEKASTSTMNHATAVDIVVATYNRQGMETKRMMLHDINQNYQSQFIKTAADTFEFQIEIPINLEGEADQPFGKEAGIVEGILRYHPFLYTKETFPGAVHEDDDDEEDEEATHMRNQSKPARGNQPIFSCYWNGRLIPYTTIKDFEWCSRKKCERTIPEECYNRVSGVLFTNDVFKVSTNKLTFQNLAEKLNAYDVVFTPKTGWQKRSNKAKMERKFRDWLQKCHNEHDKQILFKDPDGYITRNENTWTRYQSIIWCGQEFGQGKLVRTQDKASIVHGRIQCFLLEGQYDTERLSAGGFFEMKLEPEMAYGGETAVYALRFLDHTATDEDIAQSLEIEKVRLPKHLEYEWTGNHDMKTEDGKLTLVSGKATGGIRAVIRTSEGTDIKTMPTYSRGRGVKWLGVKATMCRIANAKEEYLIELENMSYINECDVAPGYHFSPFSIINPTLGDYIIRLEVIIKDPKLSGASDDLPRAEIPFTIVGDEGQGNKRLTEEKNRLQEKINVFEEKYEKLEADKKELQGMMKQVRLEGRHLLQSAGPEFVNLQTSTEIEQKRREVMEAVERISQLPRLSCRIPVYPKQDTDILGKVAHLAQVEDEREAKVLSWHLSSAMDCVVTTMKEKAEEIKDETNGEQGLLLLSRHFRSTDWEKPLPHEHTQFLGRRDSVPSNIVYAKHQLKFNVHVQKCKQVFHRLLGDVIIVDCMEDALKYQEMVLLYMDCPTILTRDGGRLSEAGTFYGSLNRCPSDLNGRVFSQPERSELHNMRRQIDVLRNAEKVFLKLANLQIKLDERESELESKDLLTERQEINTAKARVQEIENLLPKGSRKRKWPACP